MNPDNLQRKFARMGARVKLESSSRLSIDIRRDRRGEFFSVGVPDNEEPFVDAQDVRPAERHLLLVAREDRGAVTHKFLCGHDERSWFLAAVPGGHATSVRAAKDALKPPAVRAVEHRQHVRIKDRNRRHNAAFIRQGEWFFLPDPDVRVREWMILRDEPIQRSGGKPHIAEEAFRGGGEIVYVGARQRVLSAVQYGALLARHPEQAKRFSQRVRGAAMWVRGRISHPDHQTIVLRGWHQVVMNAEHAAPSMRFVQFID